MSRKKIATYILDAVIFAVAVACVIVTWIFVDDPQIFVIVAAGCGLTLFVLLCAELYSYYKLNKKEKKDELMEPAEAAVTALVLLGAGQRDIDRWDLVGKTSALIGKDSAESHADVDLKGTEYSSMIDEQHAILNYTETGWFIEDLSSRNGTGILKPGHEREQLLAAGMPCKLSPGDIICIASDTKLAVK